MAGGSLGSLTIDLAANITRFERSLTRAEQLADKRSKGIQRTFKRMAVGLGAALASFGFVRAVEQSLDFADSIGKTADKLGIATSALQEYRFAAEQTGVTSQQLDVGIQRFSRRIAEAATGTGVLVDVLDKLNIDLRDNEGNLRSTEDVLNDYADAIQNAGSGNEQLLLAFKAFDTEGVAFVNTLKNGAAGLTSFRQEARDLGIIMSDDLIRNAEKATDQLNIISKVVRINLASAIVAVAPQITAMGEAFANLVKGDLAKLPTFVKDGAFAFKVLSTVLDEVGDSIGFLASILALEIDTTLFDKINALWDARVAKSGAAQAGVQAYVDTLFDLKLAEDGLAGEVETTTSIGNAPNFLTGLTAEEMQADYDNAVAMGDQFRDIFNQQNAERLSSAQQIDALITTSRLNAVQNALGFLQVLGAKSKTAALAALAVQKGLAIAQTIISTQAASMRAMAELGPIAGPPAVASIQAMGATSIGLIAATGLLQAQQLGAGGAGGVTGGGTVADPIYTTDVNQFQPAAQTGTTGTITINVSGVVTEEILQDLIIPAIQDATNDKDVILFRSDSRQAIELEA